MHRLWFISLGLCCCLLAAVLWTSSESKLPVSEDAYAAAETARFLSALRAGWSSPTSNSESSYQDSEQVNSLGELGLPGMAQPEKAIIPTLAQPVNDLPWPESEVASPTLNPESDQHRFELAASDPSQPVTSVGRLAGETRVSIIHRPTLAPLHPELPALDNSSEAWELTSQELQVANMHLNYGKTLARKGATASARSEFLNALGVIAQSRDLRMGGKEHVAALNQAILAINEAEDFYAKPGSSHLDADVATVSEGHLSQILGSDTINQLTRSEALTAYHEFAGRNLQQACGRNWLASETLYALGRLHNLLGLADPAQQPCELGKSLTFHQAALAADANNFASANELGVLLARQGQLEEAKRLLVHSVTLSPRRETWTNLATVHQRLGETKLAQLAAAEAKIMVEQTAKSGSSSLIRLVAPAEFEALPSDQDSGPTERTVRNPNDSPNPPLR